jgi:hypothetical protein
MKEQLHRFTAALLFLGVVTTVNAQSKIEDKSFKGKEIHTASTSITNLKNKAAYSDWEYPAGAISLLTTLDRSVGILYSDSIVKLVGSDGEANFVTTHSVGAAFTPNDVNLEISTDGIRLSRYNQYTVDSIQFFYLYVRNLDSMEIDSTTKVAVVDTLIVQYFKANNLNAREQGTDQYMRPLDWNRSRLGSTNVAHEVKIPLTSLDSTQKPSSTGWLTRSLTLGLPADFDIDSDADGDALEFKNAFGFSVSFKSMLPFSFGDTIESLEGDEIQNKLNYFGVSQFTNSREAVPQSTYINNSWRVPSKLLYGEVDNGWSIAIPGLAYVSPFYLNYAVLINTTSLGTKEIENNISFGVYPNPVSTSQTLKADFNLVNANNVSIEIYDLLGNSVKTVANGYFTSGEHQLDINISDLPSGMYVYTVRSGDAVSSQKISIID